MDATTVAVDLAKDVFQVAMTNRTGRIIERKRFTRGQFERFVDALRPGAEIVMEACGTAHYWGRRFQGRGHHVRLLPTQYVQPYVRRNKTDRTDTDALGKGRSSTPWTIEKTAVVAPTPSASVMRAVAAKPGAAHGHERRPNILAKNIHLNLGPQLFREMP